MIAAKLMRMSFITIKNPAYTNSDRGSSGKLCLPVCRSKGENSSSEASQPKGDPRKQELLAKIAMLQAQKLRLTDYLDERSAFLTQFAEEANAEIDAIGENALKGLHEASARIMENIESRMQALEESLEEDKQETEQRDKELADFEGEIERNQNEGMFFQSFQQRAPVDQAKAKEEVKKINDVTNENVMSRTRSNIYLALIGLLIVGIADFFLSDPPNWRKVAVLGVILVALLSQFTYEQKMLPKSERKNDNKDEEIK